MCNVNSTHNAVAVPIPPVWIIHGRYVHFALVYEPILEREFQNIRIKPIRFDFAYIGHHNSCNRSKEYSIAALRELSV